MILLFNVHNFPSQKAFQIRYEVYRNMKKMLLLQTDIIGIHFHILLIEKLTYR